MSRTLILVKPDAFERGLTGEVLTRFERKGLRLVALKLQVADEEFANRHYAEHAEKPFFGELVEFITGGPLVAVVLEGNEAVAAARQVIGATNPLEAATGSIRATSRLEVTFNLVHGSDSDESAEREISIWFPRPRLILASASPRRREILTALGVEFEVVVPDVEELARGSRRRSCSRTRGARRRPRSRPAPRRGGARRRHRGGPRRARAGQGGGRGRGAGALRRCRGGPTRS